MANMYINAMTDLWNSAGTTYASIKMNVTNAASAAASKLIQLQIAAVDKFTVDKDGNVIAAGTVTSAGTVSSSAHLPSANDSAALGASATAWSDLFLASGGVINWSVGDVTITHASDQLLFGAATNGYLFDAAVRPTTSDGAALGAALAPWSDLYLATGAEINFAGDITLTHATDTLTVAGGDLRVTTAGTNSASVVTISGTQTLTAKTLTSPTITSPTVTGGTFTSISSLSATGTISTSGSMSATGTITASGAITAGSTVTSGQNFSSASTNVVLSAASGGVYLRPYGAANGTGQAYQATDGGFRTDFCHCVTTGLAQTYSYYNGNGPSGAVHGALIQGNGTANTAAGIFITYPNSTSYTFLGFHQPSVNYWAIYANGPCVTTVSWAVSDVKVKSNIEDCNCADAHSKVRAIGVKSYRKENMALQRRHSYDEMGFIAQEVEMVIPEAVMDVPVPKPDVDGKAVEPTESLKVTNDRTLLATLWAAFQHQADMIEQMEAKIAALEARGA